MDDFRPCLLLNCKIWRNLNYFDWSSGVWCHPSCLGGGGSGWGRDSVKKDTFWGKMKKKNISIFLEKVVGVFLSPLDDFEFIWSPPVWSLSSISGERRVNHIPFLFSWVFGPPAEPKIHAPDKDPFFPVGLVFFNTP